MPEETEAVETEQDFSEEFGGGVMDDVVPTEQDGEGTQATEQDGEGDEQAQSIDYAQIDFRNVDVNTLPEDIRPIAVAIQAQWQQQEQLIEAERQQAKQREDDLLNRATQQQNAPPQQQQEDFSYLGPMDDLEKQGAQAVQRIFEHNMQPMQAQIDEYRETFNILIDEVKALKEAALTANNAQSDQAFAALSAQHPDATGMRQTIEGMVQLTNPSTGRNYTLTEAYAVVSGRALQDTEERGEKKRVVAGNIGGSSQAVSNGKLTHADAVKNLQAVGFN